MTEALEAAATDFFVGCLFCIGIVASYIPQHVACWKLRSAKGLSLATILICAISAWTLVLASLLADWQSIVEAARENDNSLLLRILQTCNVSMTTFQNLLSTLTGIPTYVFYYFRFGVEDGAESSFSPGLREEEGEEEQTAEESPTFIVSSTIHHTKRHLKQVVATACTWTFVAFAIIFSLYTLQYQYSLVPLLIKIWGTTAAVTDMIQWIPQIAATWQNQHEGVLSLAALVIAVTGDAALAVYWIENVQSAFVYATLATDGIMQSILIAMILYFRAKRRREQVSATNSSSANAILEENNNDLETPLLHVSMTVSNHNDISNNDDTVSMSENIDGEDFGGKRGNKNEQ